MACLILCGAAAEAILKSVAEKSNIKFSKYSKLSQIINDIANSDQKIREDLTKYTDLLKYWRDEGVHGSLEKITDNEAYVSLALLLKFGMFAKDTWFQ